MNIPVISQQGPQLMGNLVQLTPAVRAASVSHWNVQPVIDVYANTQDRDLGAVAADTDKILKTFDKNLPRGTHIVMRGQVATMRSSFFGLGVGLVGAILLVYLLIVINFQSWLDPFIIITALARSVGGNLLVPAADAHDVECAIADRGSHVHGRRHGELHSDGEFRARADG